LVDTGAQKTVLRDSIHKLIGIKLDMNSVSINGVSSTPAGTLKEIRIGAISLYNSEVLVSNLGGVGKQLDKYNVAGVLGASALRELCLKIDYPKLLLEIHRSV
jgi:predicted aspartyl protease